MDCYFLHFLICGSFSRAVPIDALSLFLSSENAAVVSQYGALRVEGIQKSLTLHFDPSLPPFLAFSLILKGPSTPHKEPLFILQSHTQWTEGCFELTSSLQTKVSGEKSYSVSFPDLVCTVL